jgi:hypothetical protein
MKQQPNTRNLVAIAAHFRQAGAFGKRGKGRTKSDDRARQSVKADLRRDA